MSKLRVHNVAISSTLWFVAGRKQRQRFPAVGGGLGRGLASFTNQAKTTVWEVTYLCPQRCSPQTLIRKTKAAFPAAVSDTLSIPCTFTPGKRWRRQTWKSHLHPIPASSHHHWLAQVKNTHIYTVPRGMAGPSLPSNLH